MKPKDRVWRSVGLVLAAGLVALGCGDDASSGAPVCGDGVVEGNEECDDGNTVNNDGCSAGCVEEYCGDSVIQSGIGEECDDGNITGGDGCSPTCQDEGTTQCGNGIVETGEQCDDGNQDNNDACPDDAAGGGSCQTATCGDGFVWHQGGGTEQCDDGNTAGGDGCSTTCQLEVEPGCGNGVVEAGEQCDDGNGSNTDACLDDEAAGGTCQTATCGDGFVWVGVESCDDGNGNNNDLCPDGPGGTCQDAACGDGFVWAGVDPCDDGNQDNTDACPDGTGGTCQPAVCGDGFAWAGVEACDDGNQDNNDLCPDGTGGTCLAATCGDGFVWNTGGGSEQCDDGNTNSGDGCDATCQLESCYNPTDCGNPNTFICDVSTETCQSISQCTPGSGSMECAGANPWCFEQVSGSGLGVCYELCDPYDILCPGNLECVTSDFGQTIGICQNAGFGVAGGPCNPARDPNAYGTNTGCVAGAACFGDGTNYLCYEVCDYFGPSPTCSGTNMCFISGICDAPAPVHSSALGTPCPVSAVNGDACAPQGDGSAGFCWDLGGGSTCWEYCPLDDANYTCTVGGHTCQDVFTAPYQGDVGACFS
jgi:cysteine-rich repeat protein